MKKLLLLFITGAFVFGLSSCEDQNQKPTRKRHDHHKPYKKPYKQTPKKQKYESKW